MSSILGIIGIIASLWYVFATPSKGFAGYFDAPSAVLLLVMPPSVMLLSHSLADFLTGFSTLGRALFTTMTQRQGEVIDVLTRSSQLIRSDGLGALVKVRDQVRYELLRDGISLIVNDFTVEEIRHNLQNKINAKQTRMASAANLFENMAKLSPGVGMIGTLMGLIAMMANMKDPTQIGGGMALAMITTFYGLMLGTMLYGPFSEKILLEAEKTLEIDLMVLEGVSNLKAKKSSIHMKDIVKTFGKKSGGPEQPTPKAR